MYFFGILHVHVWVIFLTLMISIPRAVVYYQYVLLSGLCSILVYVHIYVLYGKSRQPRHNEKSKTTNNLPRPLKFVILGFDSSVVIRSIVTEREWRAPQKWRQARLLLRWSLSSEVSFQSLPGRLHWKVPFSVKFWKEWREKLCLASPASRGPTYLILCTFLLQAGSCSSASLTILDKNYHLIIT